MKPEDLSDAMGMIDDDTITDADRTRHTTTSSPQKRITSGQRHWISIVAAAACLLCFLIIFTQQNNLPDSHTVYAGTIAEAEYPETPKYSEASKAYELWAESNRIHVRQIDECQGLLDNFYKTTASQFLSGTGTENRIYSPVNVYMALSMLAELTDSESRQQILDVLDTENIEMLREQTNTIWQANYRNDGRNTSILANSIWLSDKIEYVPSTMQTLAEKYYASSHIGKMGSETYNQQLHQWLNEQTSGQLKEQINNIELSPDIIMALASTIYFQARWQNEYWSDRTTEDIFHSPVSDINCDFMYQKQSTEYYQGEHFGAISQPFKGGGSMWLLLPDENSSPEELLSNSAVFDLILTPSETDIQHYPALINLSIPKFDIVSDLDIIDTLKSLGITDVFEPDQSDFTPMTRSTNHITVSSAQHAARVSVDEEGCTATAFTIIEETAACEEPLEEEIDFILNRPFLFVITGDSGMPLFTGVVNQP